MPINIQKKIQQITKDLKEKNFKVIKINKNYYNRFHKKRIITLMNDCEQLQRIEMKIKERMMKVFELEKNLAIDKWNEEKK